MSLTPSGATAIFEGNAEDITQDDARDIYEVEGTEAREIQTTLMNQIQRIPRSMHWAVEDIELPEDDGREIAGKII